MKGSWAFLIGGKEEEKMKRRFLIILVVFCVMSAGTAYGYIIESIYQQD